MRVGHGYLDVHVFPPGGDLARLTPHLGEVVREDFKGDGTVGNGVHDGKRKCLIVGNSRFAHQGRIGGESTDEGIVVHLQHSGPVRAVRENLHFQCW